MRTKKSNLYPNLYVILVGPAGVGKSEILREVRDMWTSFGTHHVAPSSVTKAALIDSLLGATRTVVRVSEIPPVVNFNALLVCSSELGVLLPAYDNEFMNTLQDLYDGIVYSEKRRTNKIEIDIPAPFLSMLAGCTPGYLRETLPIGAWDQGFISRSLLIYGGEMEKKSLFAEDEEVTDEIKDLTQRLKDISNIYGQLKFTQEAKAFLDPWWFGTQEPKPDHPRLTSYCQRRPANLIKLSMIAAIASGSPDIIDRVHIQLALDWLLEAEFAMPDIFKAMAAGGDSQVIQDTFHHLLTLYMKGGKKPVGAHRMFHFLQERTPAHNIARILEIMERARMIRSSVEPGLGPAYTPISNKQE